MRNGDAGERDALREASAHSRATGQPSLKLNQI
jgi:hypothetical protein